MGLEQKDKEGMELRAGIDKMEIDGARNKEVIKQ